MFDSGATDSFISPSLVVNCKLDSVKQDHGWQVELASGTKVSTDFVVHKCGLSIGGFETSVDLRVIPLGSYDVVLGMDWLGSHKASIDCRKKTIKCQDDQGKDVEIVGIPRPISLRMISAMQLKRSLRKGCQVFVVTTNELDEEDSMRKTLDHPILQECADVFQSEILGMPPKRDIDFSIELTPGAEPISRAPYRMTTQELSELHLQ